MACEQPTLPIIPTKQALGSSRRQQILEDTRDYAAAMGGYVACIKAALRAAGERQAPALARTLLKRRYQTAVREFGIVTALFTKHVGSLDSLRIGQVVDSPRLTCISSALTRKTAALDDYTLLFYQRTGRIYVNTLPRRCPGLRDSRGTFAHATTLGAGLIALLCKKDSITLINGQHRGFTCRLGPFHELTQQQAAALRERGRAQPKAGSVAVTPFRLPPQKRN